jgi:predicted alpha/beta-hydrolase family hydrolase
MSEGDRKPVMVDTPHGAVATTVLGEGDIAVVLAHGAGAGQSHPWMRSLAERLAAHGVAVVTFDYAYTQAARRSPDRLPKLLDVHDAVWEDVAATHARVVLAGKSMGGRVGGHLVAEGRAQPLGLAYYGYPLVAMGATQPRPTDHLERLAVPQLFVSGDRDRLGPIDLIASLSGRVPNGELVVVPDGDHSLVPRKSTGLTLDDSLDLAAAETVRWIDRISGTPYEAGGSDRTRPSR